MGKQEIVSVPYRSSYDSLLPLGCTKWPVSEMNKNRKRPNGNLHWR
jgi:hypothetical protein